MRGLDQLIVDLVDALPGHGVQGADLALVPVDLDLDLPLTLRQDAAGGFIAALPDWRLSTGFEVPISRLRAHFETGEP